MHPGGAAEDQEKSRRTDEFADSRGSPTERILCGVQRLRMRRIYALVECCLLAATRPEIACQEIAVQLLYVTKLIVA
jgi:hypothetical protein